MKTLFITHHYLSGNGGGSFASRAYINAFAEVSGHLTLLYPIKDGEDLFDGINTKIETIPVANTAPRWKKLWHILSGKVHRYDEKAGEIAGREHFDLVVFDTSVVSYRLIDLFKKSGSRVAVIHHNYQYEYFRDNTPLWLKFPTLFWCKRYEGEAVRKADINFTLTREDIKLLADNYNSGNNANFRLLGAFESGPSPSRVMDNHSQEQRFVITGNLSAIQTKKSLKPWIRNYFPILKEVFPEAKLTIAGKDPDKELIDICSKRAIQLISSPVSMDPIMAKADYYLCPICLGGGIKLRIMDGLKWGLPVISHSVSSRGYDNCISNGIVFPYDSPGEFRNKLKELKTYQINKDRIQKTYEAEFSFQSGLNRLSNAIATANNIIKDGKN